ncbi:MAG: RsmF rRNA methyltransferase first C-terminal domain-containing protein [Erysipelotrichales bacterium]|nr:RsmF rRNA methyltransferase first C-terminal domain-containing protein [Erysipelotrichales bacterium]
MDFKEHILSQYDENKAKKLLESLDNPRTHALIINRNKISEEEFIKSFPGVIKHPIVEHAFLYDKNKYDMGKSIYHDAGAIYISDASSLTVAYMLDVNSNDMVLDMCAAPGGKTIQTSLRMNNEGIIISNDLSYNRALVLSQNVERMGRKNIIVTCNDLSKITKYAGTFSKIILDAPCSGSGMFRKDEKMLLDWSIEKVYKQATIQKELIELAYFFLMPGGTLIYSTCSYSREENYEIIKGLIERHKDMHIVPLYELSMYSLTDVNEGITLAPSTYFGEGQYLCKLKKDGELRVNDYICKEKVVVKEFNNLTLQGNIIKKDNSIYLSPTNLALKEFNIIRNGLKVGEYNKNIFTPDHHLSHYLPAKDSIILDDKCVKEYLNGATINMQYNSGFHTVSYRNFNLGFVKASNGQLKNHYPKGLRHK